MAADLYFWAVTQKVENLLNLKTLSHMVNVTESAIRYSTFQKHKSWHCHLNIVNLTLLQHQQYKEVSNNVTRMTRIIPGIGKPFLPHPTILYQSSRCSSKYSDASENNFYLFHCSLIHILPAKDSIKSKLVYLLNLLLTIGTVSKVCPTSYTSHCLIPRDQTCHTSPAGLDGSRCAVW